MIKKMGYKCPAAPINERNVTCAYLEDPDGYKFKLIQRKKSREPFSQVSFRVADVDRSILYHQDVSPLPSQTMIVIYLSRQFNCS